MNCMKMKMMLFQQPSRSLLKLSAEVITVNENDDIVEAVAVQGEKIVAAGSNEDILNLKTKSSKIIDLEGRTLMPGFIDPHLHITMYGTNSISISCKSKSIKSIDDLLKQLKDRAENIPNNNWVRAWGYNETLIA